MFWSVPVPWRDRMNCCIKTSSFYSIHPYKGVSPSIHPDFIHPCLKRTNHYYYQAYMFLNVSLLLCLLEIGQILGHCRVFSCYICIYSRTHMQTYTRQREESKSEREREFHFNALTYLLLESISNKLICKQIYIDYSQKKS